MTETKKTYIEQLLDRLSNLQTQVSQLNDNDVVPFSFFRKSFETVQEISHLLHELELHQIDDMKAQMGKLVAALTEMENLKTVLEDNDRVEETVNDPDEIVEEHIEEEKIVEEERGVVKEAQKEKEEIEEEITIPIESDQTKEPPFLQTFYIDNVSIPNFKRVDEIKKEKEIEVEASVDVKTENEQTNGIPPSLNDKMKPSASVIDLNHYLSLNDRYLFLRELFHNNRDEMTSVLNELATLNNFDDAETYLKNGRTWDFEDETVKSFLSVVKKGFE